MDYGHAQSQKMLDDLEKKIHREFQIAAREVERKGNAFFQRSIENGGKMYDLWQSGEITNAEYRTWLDKQTILNHKWASLRDDLTAVYMDADRVAMDMINNHRYDVYALNYNYGTYEVEKQARVNTNFALYDRDTVTRLMKDDPKLLPPAGKATSEAIRRGELKAWTNRQLQSVMTQSIIQGESIDKIAKRLATTVGERQEYQHYRAARTMTTGAENAGRLDSYKRAESMGITMGKTWLAAHDTHTRKTHRHYDGMTLPINEEFAPNLMYPADPLGDPAEVYNCRCTLVGTVVAVDGIDLSDLTDVGDWADLWGIDYEAWVDMHSVASAAGGGMASEPIIEQELTFKEKIDKIKADDTLTIEEKVSQAGKVMADDMEANYLQPMRDKYSALETNFNELTKRASEIDAEMDRLAEIALGITSPSEYGLATVEEALRRQKELETTLIDVLDRKNIARAEMMEASRAMGRRNYADHAEALKTKLSEIRSMGADGIDLAAHLNRSRSSMRKEVEWAYNCYPTEWVNKSVARGYLTPKKVNRGYYSDWEKVIALSGNGGASTKSTAIHELGHRFERAVPEIRERERIFYERRTAGEELEWLGAGYRRNEVTRKDQFISMYMGKDYGGSAYELVSMGFQYAYTEPFELAKDRDMQEWIYGMLCIL